jgi:hypothetical protein
VALYYFGLVVIGVLILYVALAYQLYRRAFLPPKPLWLDDFSFTPFEFQADYEEVELTTADGSGAYDNFLIVAWPGPRT